MANTDWVYTALLAVTGAAIGSFLNVCADRLPLGQSLVFPPSHCPSCQTRLRATDLVPVVSYLALRGKCRYCGARIPLRIFLVELASGTLFAFIWARYGGTYEGIALLGYASLFLLVFIIDLEHGIIPNLIVFPSLAIALAVASFSPDIGPGWALAGAAAGFGILLAIYLLPGSIVGGGDVKFAAVVGAATGFPLVIVGLALAFVSGGVVALALLATRRRKRRDTIPFGPFIAASALATLLWGEAIGRWYLESLLL